MKKEQVTNEHSMEFYCQQGLQAEETTAELICMRNPRKITTIETADFGDGYHARKVHTIHAEAFWMLFRDKELLHITTSFSKLKDAVYTIRRLQFGPQNTNFLMTGKQKEDMKKKEMEDNLRTIEMI